MPPAMSDESGASDAGSDRPAPVKPKTTRGRRGRKPKAYKEELPDEDMDDGTPPAESVLNGDDEDEADLGADEFIVEKICSHLVDQKGELKFEVKWEGYEKKSDRTMESEENLRSNASQILDDYLASIGGRDKLFEETAKAVKTKKRGRPSAGTPNTSVRVKRSRGMGPQSDDEQSASSKAAQWKPPTGSWEDHVAHLDACKDELGDGSLTVYITWKNGHKTQHGTGVVYQRCPQKMLQFYERHVKIVRRDSEGSDTAEIAVDATTKGRKKEDANK